MCQDLPILSTIDFLVFGKVASCGTSAHSSAPSILWTRVQIRIGLFSLSLCICFILIDASPNQSTHW